MLLASARTPDDLEQKVRRRLGGTPLEQVVGWAEFAGLRVAVEPGVFVPRRRTELLLRYALLLAPPRPVVVELCCGSAALSLAVGSTLTYAELYATDIDPAALRCAHRNLASLQAACVLQGDLYEPLPPSLTGRVDLLLANPPYVPTGAIALMPPEARLYEPRIALDGGSDGLEIQRRIAAGAARWLAPDGRVLVETSHSQVDGTVAAFQCHRLATEVGTADDLDATVVIGWLPSARRLQSQSGARQH